MRIAHTKERFRKILCVNMKEWNEAGPDPFGPITHVKSLNGPRVRVPA
jgi:hypothetical protein